MYWNTKPTNQPNKKNQTKNQVIFLWDKAIYIISSCFQYWLFKEISLPAAKYGVSVISFFYITLQLFTMALPLLLLLLLLQDAQGFCAEFVGLWWSSAPVTTASLRLVGPRFWKQHYWCSQQGNISEQKPLGKTESRDIQPGGRDGYF